MRYWNKTVKNSLRKSFKKTDFTLDFGDGYLNIMRSDGIHCEFYPSYEDSEHCYLTATYTVFGNKNKEINILIPDEIQEFVEIVKDILCFYSK